MYMYFSVVCLGVSLEVFIEYFEDRMSKKTGDGKLFNLFDRSEAVHFDWAIFFNVFALISGSAASILCGFVVFHKTKDPDS